MKSIKYIAPILAFLMLGACKKDKLTGLRSIFVGEWEWVYSKKFTNYTTPPFASTEDTIFATNLSTTYSLNFIEKGKIQLIENGNVQSECRTVFSSFNNGGGCASILNSPYEFSIDLDNDEENVFNGCVNSDTLITYNFPFPKKQSTNTTIIYWHYFKKID